MRILHLNLQGGGVAEYRHFSPARALIRAGHAVTYCENTPLPDNLEQYFLDNAHTFDVIHVGYTTDAGVLKLLAAVRNFAGLHIITDIDDDIHNVPSYNRAYTEYHGGAQERRIVIMNLRISDGVTLTTEHLRKSLETDCKRVSILPNCLDKDAWPQGIANPACIHDQSVRVMLTGSTGHFSDFAESEDAVTWAMGKFPHLRLFCGGWAPDWAWQWAEDDKNPHVNRMFQIQPANVETYRRSLEWVSPHIFIAPLKSSKFNDAKSHIKIYDAVMCGAAFMCSDVGAYESVPNECCVKVSNTPFQWREGLNALITDHDLRARLHQRLKEYVFDTWPIDNHIHKWVEFYSEVREAPVVNSLEDIVHPA